MTIFKIKKGVLILLTILVAISPLEPAFAERVADEIIAGMFEQAIPVNYDEEVKLTIENPVIDPLNDVQEEVNYDRFRMAEKDIEKTLEQLNSKMNTTQASSSEGGTIEGSIQNKIFSTPIKITDNTLERISMADASLEYTVKDFVLPGVNGLDLTIARRYSSDNANYFDRFGYITELYNSQIRDIKTYLSYNRRKLQIIGDGEVGIEVEKTVLGENSGYFRSNLSTESLRYAHRMEVVTKSGDYYYVTTIKAMTPSPLGSNYTRTQKQISFNYGNYTTRIGAGWDFCFTHIDPYRQEIHLEDGRVFPLITSKQVAMNTVPGDLIFTTFPYESREVEVKELNNDYIINGIGSKWTLQYKDGKKEYFYNNGDLMAIADRFGNCIEFTYTISGDKKNIFIKDSMNRQIAIVHENKSYGHDTIVMYDNKEMVRYENTYNQAMTSYGINNSAVAGDWNFNSYNLTKVHDAMGNETAYSYTNKSFPCDFVNKYLYPGIPNSPAMSTGCYYALLDEIEYPTGMKTVYDYGTVETNWLDYGVILKPMVNERYDQIEGLLHNHKEYKFSVLYPEFDDDDEPIGCYYSVPINGMVAIYNYPQGTAFGHWVANESPFASYEAHEIDKSRNARTVYEFKYRTGYNTSISTYVNDQGGSLGDIKEKTTYGSRVWGGNPKQIEITKYKANGGVGYTHTIQDEYNTFCDNISNTTNHTVEFQYHPEFHYPIKTEYYLEAGRKITHLSTPTSNGKSIEMEEIFENDVLKEKQLFGYDSYGNITQQKDYVDDSLSQYITTIYGYGNSGGGYLEEIRVPGVRDADGIALPDVIYSYGYDNFGRQTSATDPNGNTISYQYNDLNHLTRKTYAADANYETYDYNYTANTVLVRDLLGTQYLYKYDQAGNLSGVYDHLTGSKLSGVEYDSSWRKTKEYNFAGANGYGETHIDYDCLDRVTAITTKNAAGDILAKEQYQYDANANGDINTKTILGDNKSPNITTKEYIDPYGRTYKASYFNNSSEYATTYTYDNVGNLLKYLNPQSAFNGLSYSGKYEYDHSGRVCKEYNADGDQKAISYDGLGRKKAETDYKGYANSVPYSTQYSYDSLGRLIKTILPFNEADNSIRKYYHDPNGNILCEKKSNGIPGEVHSWKETRYEYNNRGFLTKVISLDKGQPKNYVQYYYDAAGNPLRVYTGLSSPLTISGLDQTAGTDTEYAVAKYDYDRFGNLTCVTDPLNQEEEYNYNLNCLVTGKTDRNGNVITYQYDGAGRTVNIAVANTDGSQNHLSAPYTLVFISW